MTSLCRPTTSSAASSAYGLYGVLRLHNAQEDETAFSLIPEAPEPIAATRGHSSH
jgi:hypothetical protein